MNPDPWELLGTMTINELITATKLRGSATTIRGTTKPEGYPFELIVAVGSTTENMAAVGVLKRAAKLIGELASYHIRVDKDPL